MTNSLKKFFRVDSRESKKHRSRQRRRTFGCERLEERITLSATTAPIVEFSSVTLSPSEGGFVAFDIGLPRTQGNRFLFDLDGDGTLFLSRVDRVITNGLSGDWQDVDSGQVVNSGTGGLSNVESPFATIPPPDPIGQTQPAGGTIAIAEIFVPSPNSHFSSSVAEAITFRPLGEQNFRAAELPTSSQSLPAARGRDISFEVAFTQPTHPTARVAKAAEGLLAPPIAQASFFPQDGSASQEDGASQTDAHPAQVAAAYSAPIHSETSGRTANNYSPASHPVEIQFVSSDDASITSFQSSEAPYPADAGDPRTPLHDVTAFDQVFANWQDRRTQVAQLREQDHDFFTWEVVVALAFGGLVVRCQHSPTGSEIEQEPPQRKKSANHKNLA